MKTKEEDEEKARKKARKEAEEKRAAEKRAARKALKSSSSNYSDDDDDDELTESEMKMFRGYKKTSDGRTTSYFTREQTDEEKKLLGNIAPQKLATTPQPLDSTTSTTSPTNASSNAASAWNQAGTWEEKNTSDWCNSSLEGHLKETRVELNSLVGKVTKVNDLIGEASVVMVSGKKRYVFDYSTTLKFKIVDEKEDEFGSGTFKVPEISSTSIDEELEVLVTGWKMNDSEDVGSAAALQCRDTLVNQVRSQVIAFVAAFNTQF